MAGDVNIFINNADNDKEGEIEIMIAASSSRGKGIAKESLQIMMHYAYQTLGINLFVAKIGESNEASRKLFTQLGFEQIGEPNYFKEVLVSFYFNSSFT